MTFREYLLDLAKSRPHKPRLTQADKELGGTAGSIFTITASVILGICINPYYFLLLVPGVFLLIYGQYYGSKIRKRE